MVDLGHEASLGALGSRFQACGRLLTGWKLDSWRIGQVIKAATSLGSRFQACGCLLTGWKLDSWRIGQVIKAATSRVAVRFTFFVFFSRLAKRRIKIFSLWWIHAPQF